MKYRIIKNTYKRPYNRYSPLETYSVQYRVLCFWIYFRDMLDQIHEFNTFRDAVDFVNECLGNEEKPDQEIVKIYG